MDNRRAVIRVRYNSPLGHTTANLPKDTYKQKESNAKKFREDAVPRSKAGKFISWFNRLQIRNRQISLAKIDDAYEVGTITKEERDIVPKLFKMANNLIADSEYVKMRYIAGRYELPLQYVYEKGGYHYAKTLNLEKKEVDIITIKINAYEKQLEEKYGSYNTARLPEHKATV